MLAPLFESFRLALSSLIVMLDYPGLFLVSIVVAPEFVMPFAGFLVLRGELSFLGVLIAGTLGTLLGSAIPYGLARWLGEERLRRFLRRRRSWLFSERDLDRGLRLFARYDQSLVFLGRFVLTMRSLVVLPAGLAAMPVGKFLLLTGMAATLWNVVLVYLGMELGRNWTRILAFFEVYELLVWLMLSMALLFFLTRRVRRLVTTQPSSRRS